MHRRGAVMTDHAKEMFRAALNYCHDRVGKADLANLLRANDAMALGYFRYGLAHAIGALLGGMDDLVRAVYVCPEEILDEESSATLPLTLIVWVERRTAALEAVVEGLERELLGGYRELLEPLADRLQTLTNICFLDDEDRRQRRGMAAFINSLHTPALEVWRR